MTPILSKTPGSMLIGMTVAQNAVALPENMPGHPDGIKQPNAGGHPAQQPAPSPYAAPPQQQYVPSGQQQYVPNSVPEQ
jgi:hypothetical protein